MGFLPQLPTTFCSLLWREYENVTKSLGLVLPFFLGYPILKTLEPVQGLSPSLSPGSAWPWLTEVRSFNWMHFLSSTTWPRRPMVNWRVKRDPVDPGYQGSQPILTVHDWKFQQTL